MFILLTLKATHKWLTRACRFSLAHGVSMGIFVGVLAGLSGCGGGGYGGGSGGGGGFYGSSSSASSSSSSSAAAMALEVSPTQTFSVKLQPEQIYPVPVSTALASGDFTFNAATGGATATVMLSGIAATEVTINDAFAGNTGGVILNLAPNSSDTNTWSIASNATLTADQLNDLMVGKFYVVVDSAAYPQGELRGQLLPSGISVLFAGMSGDQEVPPVTTTASGMAAVTVNTISKLAAVNVNVSGANTASGIELFTGSAGTNGMPLAMLVPDHLMPGHWLNEGINLTDADIANYNANQWYVNVLTPSHVSGEIRGQFVQPTVR